MRKFTVYFCITLSLFFSSIALADTPMVDEEELKALSLLPENQPTSDKDEMADAISMDNLSTSSQSHGRPAYAAAPSTNDDLIVKTQVLKGTWFFSYTLSNNFTDKIVISGDPTLATTNYGTITLKVHNTLPVSKGYSAASPLKGLIYSGVSFDVNGVNKIIPLNLSKVATNDQLNNALQAGLAAAKAKDPALANVTITQQKNADTWLSDDGQSRTTDTYLVAVKNGSVTKSTTSGWSISQQTLPADNTISAYQVANTFNISTVNIKGLRYPDNRDGTTSSNGRPILCDYNPSLYAQLNSEYFCMETGSFPSVYYFKFSGNTITGGYYGIGSDIESAKSNAQLKNKPITGYLEASSVTPTDSSSISCVFNWLESKYSQYYAPASNDASLLIYNGNSYRYYVKTDSLLVYNPTYDHVYSGYKYYGSYYYIDLGSFSDWKKGTGCSRPEVGSSPTTHVNIKLNLNSGASTPAGAPFIPNDPTTYNNKISITINDALGKSHIATTYYVKSPVVDNNWDMYLFLDGFGITTGGPIVPPTPPPLSTVNGGGVAPAFGVPGTTGVPVQLAFTQTGILAWVDGVEASKVDFGAIDLSQINPNLNVAPLTFSIDYFGSTQYSKPFNIYGLDQDGLPTRNSQLLKIGDNGPAGGIVFFVDSSGLHGLEAQRLDYVDYGVGGATFKWQDAMTAAKSYGTGWHLPTKDELNILYTNKAYVGSFAPTFYWSSTEYGNNEAWSPRFTDGAQYGGSKLYPCRVRAVRAF